MIVLANKLIIDGGETNSGDITNKLLALDEEEWKDYNEMPTARKCAAAKSILSGQTKFEGKWRVVATTEVLDTTNGCWYTCYDLPVPHHQLKVATHYKQHHLLAGWSSSR